MAKLGDIKLLDGEYRFPSGIAVPLEYLQKFNRKLKIDDNHEIEVHSANPYVVLRSVEETTIHSPESLNEVVQVGLDLLAVESGLYLSTTNGASEYLTWFKEAQGHVLRIVSTYNFTPTINIQIENHIKSSGKPLKLEPQYQRCLRYIRQSMASKNSFDAYRYMYLALENLCGFLEKKSGSEERWLLKILTSSTLKSISKDLFADKVIQDIYSVRNRLFHAKDYEDILLPCMSTHEKVVDRAFLDLAQIVKILVGEILSIDLNLSSWSRKGLKRDMRMSRQAFDSVGKVFEDLEFHLCRFSVNNSTSSNLSSLAELSPSVKMEETSYIAGFPRQENNALIGSLSLTNLNHFELMNGLALRQPSQDLNEGVVHLKCDLDLSLFDRVEALMIFEVDWDLI